MGNQSNKLTELPSMNLLNLMSNRRSIRSFSAKPISEDSLNNIIKASTLGPSGLDKLPFATIIVRDPETKTNIRAVSEKLEQEFYSKSDDNFVNSVSSVGHSFNKPHLTEAPVLLIVIGDTTYPKWRESTWIAVAYIALAIEAEGLGSLTYTPPSYDFLHEILDIPAKFSLEVIIPVGYPEEKPPPKSPRVDGKMFFDKFGNEK
jgi:nitroreductase